MHHSLASWQKNSCNLKKPMKTKFYFIGGGAAVALIIVYNRWERIQGNDDFQEGYAAGFLTPGPFTIMALAGIVAWKA